MNEQLVVWGAIVLGGSSALAWATFLMKVGGYVARIDAAEERAEEAEKKANDAHTQISAQAGALGLFRELVARDYVSIQAMRDLKTELSQDFDRLGRSNSEGLRAVHARLDDLFKLLPRLAGSDS